MEAAKTADTEREYLRDYSEGLVRLLNSEFGRELEPYIAPYLRRQPSIEELWGVLDAVWDEMRVDADDPSSLANYYSHPVWLYNGLLMECDPACVRMRYQVVRTAAEYRPGRVLDAGGGTGGLLKIAHAELPEAERLDLVDISTRWRSYVRGELLPFQRIRVLDAPEPPYDVVVSTEVMEHLPNPFEALSSINRLLKPGGLMIATWSFFPMMKAHLPRNFGLARWFHRLVPLFGMRSRKKVNLGKADHFVFQKARELRPEWSEFFERSLGAARPLFALVHRCLP